MPATISSRLLPFAALVLSPLFAMSISMESVRAEDVEEVVRPAGESLRGFGRVEVRAASLPGGVERLRFLAASEDAARTVAGRFLADLRHSWKVEPATLDGTPAFVTAGGQAFLVARRGVETVILGAPALDALATHLENSPTDAEGAVASAPYPAYMDRFGWGLYGMAGHENYHDWMKGHDGKPDPKEDFQFLKDMGDLPFDNWITMSSFDASDGLPVNEGQRWKARHAAAIGLPLNYRVYVNAGGADWTARRFPEYLEQPAWFIQSGWLRTQGYSRSNRHFTWYAPEIHGYLARQTQKMLRRHQSPDNRGWMHPHGELVHVPWYDMHADYSPAAHRHWIDYLRRRGVSLDDANAMFQRGDEPFQSFEQVPIPEFATFAGLPGQVLSLTGEWFYRKEIDKAPNDAAWWQKPAAERYAGLAEKWYSAPDLSAWRTLTMPGSELFYALSGGDPDATSTIWFRRQFAWDPALAPGRKVFLYFHPMSIAQVHSGVNKRYHPFFLNGEKIGEIGMWGALDVTDHLRPGYNDLAFQLHGGIWNGRIFLSTDTPRVFPHLGDARNRLWTLWREWRVDAKFDAWRVILDAMRQVDPEKPIKFMAPQGFGGPRWRQLALRYGGFPHFTGEGRWYYPWYKRAAKLYGIPGSSELSGPADTVEEQAEGFRRVFLAGLDNHEPVFLTQTYSRNPEIRQWWLDHKDILHRLGKYDIDGPQVLLYRSSDKLDGHMNPPYPALGDGARTVQSPWNWDIGRGTLQTLGQSCLYLDDDGVTDGKMFGYPVVMDSGNEVIDPETIDGLRRYVENGGVFIALPFTGRSTTLKPDSWPVAALTGCPAPVERPLGGKVTFGPDQAVFRALAGQTFDDDGRSVDFIGNNMNEYSLELAPADGVDATVLATYENGKPAIVARRLGKGLVVTLGTVFWRDAEDRAGLWWPGVGETAFVDDLLRGVGFDEAVCRTDDRLVWAQPYRANNGLDDVVVLVNWNEEGTQKPTVAIRLPRRPAKLVCHRVGGSAEVPFTWADGVLRATLDMPAREVFVLDAESHAPKDAVLHWWSRQHERWRGIVPATGDFSIYDSGRWQDPTQDLSENARFTNTPPDGDWTAADFDDAAWTPAPLDVFHFWGAKENEPVWARTVFRVDPAWLDNGLTRLISGAWSGPHYLTPTRMILNGTELHGATRNSFNEFDVSRLLRAGDNVLAFALEGGAQYVGFTGNVFLNHREKPIRSLDLAGVWTGRNDRDEPATLRIPGDGRLRHPAKKVFIPEDWRGQYQVRFFEMGDPYGILGVWVNGRLARRHHHHLGRYLDVDITAHLKFGEENTLELAYGSEYRGRRDDETPRFAVNVVRLDLFPARRTD